MRKGFATLAVVGAAACIALYTFSPKAGASLYAETTEEDR